MKMTMTDGTVFEGSMAEYAELLAFAKSQQAEETTETDDTIEFEGGKYRKVDRRAKSGDVVIFRKNTSSAADNGVPYAVSSPTRSSLSTTFNSWYGALNVYHKSYGRTTETVDVYEPIVKAESKPKLKAGDFVKFEKDGKDITAGKVYKVEIADSGSLYVLDDAGRRDYRVGRRGHKYEILSAEEVAKHRESEKWSKIGRKPGEFKVGDIAEVVEYNSGHKVGTIVKITDEITPYDATDGNMTYCYNAGRLKLIAPVDARFDK